MNPRRVSLQVISWAACGLTILAPLGFLIGWIGLDSMKWWLLAATAIWFAVTPWWMGREHGSLAQAPRSDRAGA